MSSCESRSSSHYGGKLGVFLMVVLSLCFLLHSCVHEKVKEVNIQSSSRKLLTKEVVNVEVTERIGETCSRDDIAVYQGATTPLPNGIPTYTVQILNVCNSGCTISGIHVSCGWFSSARMINPKIFRRVGYDDCLVNDGAGIGPGGSLSFQYANTFRYPLSVSSVTC